LLTPFNRLASKVLSSLAQESRILLLCKQQLGLDLPDYTGRSAHLTTVMFLEDPVHPLHGSFALVAGHNYQ
jgi:hypothetical protein